MRCCCASCWSGRPACSAARCPNPRYDTFRALAMTTYVISVLVTITIFGLVAASLDLLIGYTGLFFIAQAGVFGLGAYASAIAAQKLGIGFWGGAGVAIA